MIKDNQRGEAKVQLSLISSYSPSRLPSSISCRLSLHLLLLLLLLLLLTPFLPFITYISALSRALFLCSKPYLHMDSRIFHTHSPHQPDQDNHDVLKARISTHPLYELVLQAHLDCLKVGEISNMESEQKIDRKQALNKQNLGVFSESELDLFMETYCSALEKLKEAMEEPQRKSMAFINNMHSQLKELTTTSLPHQPSPPTSSAHCKFQSDSSI